MVLIFGKLKKLLRNLIPNFHYNKKMKIADNKNVKFKISLFVRRFFIMGDNKFKKKERQLDNLENLVENYTRTERHLEQYSEVGEKEYKDIARKKQNIRENEIENLKNNIINDGNQTISEQINNIRENYDSTHRYMEDNYEKIPKEMWDNMNKKQDNRVEQVENLIDKLAFDEE